MTFSGTHLLSSSYIKKKVIKIPLFTLQLDALPMAGVWYSPFRQSFFLNFTGVELIYHVVLVSGVQQSDSAVHIHIYIPYRFFSHIGYHRILSRVPCAIQWVLVDCLFYI